MNKCQRNFWMFYQLTWCQETFLSFFQFLDGFSSIFLVIDMICQLAESSPPSTQFHILFANNFPQHCFFLALRVIKRDENSWQRNVFILLEKADVSYNQNQPNDKSTAVELGYNYGGILLTCHKIFQIVCWILNNHRKFY